VQDNNSIPQFALAQVRPFDERVFGAKVPDEATFPSAVADTRDQIALTTGATYGGAGVVFRTGGNIAYVNTTPASSTSWTFGAAYAGGNFPDNQAALVANFAALRTVAYGVKITTRQSATVASGFVHVAICADSMAGTTWSYPTSVSQMEYCDAYRRIPVADLVQDEIIVSGRYYDQTAFQYHDPNAYPQALTGTATAFNSMSGWGAIIVWFEGPVSIANAIDIDIVYHYEGIVGKSGTSTILRATKASPHSPAILAATSYVMDQSDPITVVSEQKEGGLMSWVKKAYNTGMAIASGVAPLVAKFIPHVGVPMMTATSLLPKRL